MERERRTLVVITIEQTMQARRWRYWFGATKFSVILMAEEEEFYSGCFVEDVKAWNGVEGRIRGEKMKNFFGTRLNFQVLACFHVTSKFSQ